MNTALLTEKLVSKKWLQRFFSKDCSLEHQQARAGIYLYSIGLISAIYSAVFQVKDALPYAPEVLLTFVGCAILFSLHTCAYQAFNRRRRLIKNSMDFLILAFVFANGYAGCWGFFAGCSMVVGTGFRFGTKAMIWAILQNMALMVMALFYVDYYHDNPEVWSTIFLFSLVASIYTSTVVQKLHAVKKRLSEMAMHDSLTGLPNRRLFMEHMLRHMFESRRSNKQVACFFLDLDGFKKVNDTLGHPIGDKLLIKVSAVIKSKLRTSDICARLGGDEFVVVVACDSRPKDVLMVAERILHGIEGIREVSDLSVKVSASIGVAYYASERGRSGTPDPDRLLSAADKAMYIAKNGGKGRIVTSDEIITDD